MNLVSSAPAFWGEKHKPIGLIFACLFLLGACSSGIEKSAETGLQQPQFDEVGEQAGSLSITLTSEARKEASDDLKFDINKFEGTIRRSLELKNLLAEKDDSSLPTIEVTVTSVRVRSNFSAIMFGFLAGDDHIDGEVVVRSSDGNATQKFSVSASYALGGLAGGQDGARMDWLYESFAERMTEELTGDHGES